MTSDSLQQKIDQLRLQLIERLPHDVGLMEGLLRQATSDGVDDDVVREIKVVAHRMAGSSARFGYPQLSALAARLEDHTAEMLRLETDQADGLDEIAALIEALRLAIARPD